MKYASIDIGTNAVLLLIVDQAALEEITDASTITRLGEGVLAHGRLSGEAMERTIRVLEGYRRIIDGYGARVTSCFGTSALRESENRDEFIRAAQQRAGLRVRVMSEREEAYYTYLSVKNDPQIEGERLVIIDIGGGSTEVTRGTRERFEGFISLPLGTVKLTEQFIRHDPPLVEELEAMTRFIRGQVGPKQAGDDRRVVGMAGTMTTLAAMILGLGRFEKGRIHGMEIALSTLHEWIERLAPMTKAARRALPGMEPGREDLLLQGMILMEQIVASLGAGGFAVSTYGARYGVIHEALGEGRGGLEPRT
jgi:exopolyphosphatase/guanosine-5'-triphosphate,3'-diphosphate pyrophosphatase